MCARYLPPLIRAIDPSLLPFGVRAHNVRPYTDFAGFGGAAMQGSVFSFLRIDKPASRRYNVAKGEVNTMLDSKDLELLRSMMQEVVGESEARMTDKIDSSIAASESRMTAEIKATESRIMGFIESAVMPKFDILADGHKLLNETLAPKSRVEELEEEISFLKPLVLSMLTDIDKLKKAQ